MAFYTRLNPTEPVQVQGEIYAFSRTAVLPRDYPCTLRIFVDPTSGRYSYQFIQKEFILWHKDDTITFLLRNEIPNTEAVIVTHLSTDHADHTGKKKVDLLDSAGAPVSDPTQIYKGKIKKARYKLDIKQFELVHIGLIVEVISNTPGLDSEFLLCDPQVGNGPPR